MFIRGKAKEKRYYFLIHKVQNYLYTEIQLGFRQVLFSFPMPFISGYTTQ